jgi:hypothetical protein
VVKMPLAHHPVAERSAAKETPQKMMATNSEAMEKRGLMATVPGDS